MRVAIDGSAQSILTPDLKRLRRVCHFLQVLPAGSFCTNIRSRTSSRLITHDGAARSRLACRGGGYPAKPYDRVRADQIRD